MGTVIPDMPQINPGNRPRWDRFERADLFEQYRELRTQGLSERQAAKELNHIGGHNGNAFDDRLSDHQPIKTFGITRYYTDGWGSYERYKEIIVPD